jgi:hypothetical protein
MALTHRATDGAVTVRIVETEAYLGPEDWAAHSFPAAPATLLRSTGHLYVYRIYGLDCLNVVWTGTFPKRCCRPGGDGRSARPTTPDPTVHDGGWRWSRKPGRAMASIEPSGMDLLDGPLRFGRNHPERRASGRVSGLRRGRWARPYRFWIADERSSRAAGPGAASLRALEFAAIVAVSRSGPASLARAG